MITETKAEIVYQNTQTNETFHLDKKQKAAHNVISFHQLL